MLPMSPHKMPWLWTVSYLNEVYIPFTYWWACSMRIPLGSRYCFLVKPVFPSAPTKKRDCIFRSCPSASRYEHKMPSSCSERDMTSQPERSSHVSNSTIFCRSSYSNAGCLWQMKPIWPVPPSVYGKELGPSGYFASLNWIDDSPFRSPSQ